MSKIKISTDLLRRVLEIARDNTVECINNHENKYGAYINVGKYAAISRQFSEELKIVEDMIESVTAEDEQ